MSPEREAGIKRTIQDLFSGVLMIGLGVILIDNTIKRAREEARETRAADVVTVPETEPINAVETE
jgi:hypothetical protein